MVYTPQKHPKEALISITLIVTIGILGGIFINKLFIISALIYWMQYTLILSYLQLKSKKKHNWNGVAELLLHPQIRFFLFEYLAIIGLYAVLYQDSIYLGSVILLGWLAFSINFYFYYRKIKRNKK